MSPLVSEEATLTDEPEDVPEGRAQVLMSATLFKEWAKQQGVTIVRWGPPEPWSGSIYTPTITKKETP